MAYGGMKVAAIVAAYNEENHVGAVVRTMPDFVDFICITDDASSDGTSAAALEPNDPRVHLTRHEVNQGAGAATVTAHKKALELGADIMVVMAGDAQMEPAYLPELLDPIVEGRCDFTKGNRFFSARSYEGMPQYRVFGNIVLTFMTKVSTGYWNMVDPQNGYTAISRRMSEKMDWDTVAKDYSFENDVLGRLWINNARIEDVDIPAVYGEEISDIKLGPVMVHLTRTLNRVFWQRIFVRYVLRSFSPIVLFGGFGSIFFLVGLIYGLILVASALNGVHPSAGTVMIAVLPFLMGFQLLLAALVLDIMNTPK